MNTYSLKLISYHFPEIEIPLFSNIDFEEKCDYQKYIYSDDIYRFKVCNLDWGKVSECSLFINHEEVQYDLFNGFIMFYSSSYTSTERPVFIDYFGYVFIELKIIFNNGETKTISSSYIPLLVKSNEKNQQIGQMLDYISKNNGDLLFTKEYVPTKVSSFQDKTHDNLTEKLFLAENIANYYESNYGYFKANARFNIAEKSEIDYTEKLQDFSPTTLRFMSTHPEYLIEQNTRNGIQIGTKYFYPEKTLINKKIRAYNTEENKIIVGFLKTVISELNALFQTVDNEYNRIPPIINYRGDYVHSISILYENTMIFLDNIKERINKLLSKYNMLWNLYSNTLILEHNMITRIPKPTPIFMSVPQYNIIFNGIVRWFNFGKYDFEIERSLLSFFNVPYIYELYVCSKLVQEIKALGYVLTDIKHHNYLLYEKAKFKNSLCNNIFEFEKNNEKITLYYQPVIFSTECESMITTKLFLYRCSSYSLNGSRGQYYAPDFVIKYSHDDKNSYSILDAKYKTLENVNNSDAAKLCFKYIFSVTGFTSEDILSGMYIIYGKDFDDSGSLNIYDMQRAGSSIKPSAYIFPIQEDNKERTQYYIKKILNNMME